MSFLAPPSHLNEILTPNIHEDDTGTAEANASYPMEDRQWQVGRCRTFLPACNESPTTDGHLGLRGILTWRSKQR